HILQPLAMDRSSFAQPPPHRDALATGYRWVSGQFKPVPYLYLNIGPAASLASTATDMAHFMIAHLNGGEYQGSRILSPEAIADMHTIHFRSHPALPGTGYGFRERRVNGRNVIGHLGSLRGYSSSLTLMGDRRLGLFIAANSFSGIHSQLLRQFFDRYFPAPPDADVPVATLDPADLDLNLV
ncbi:serine hydrolase, partial [filamentous cyanobacterium CCT1]